MFINAINVDEKLHRLDSTIQQYPHLWMKCINKIHYSLDKILLINWSSLSIFLYSQIIVDIFTLWLLSTTRNKFHICIFVYVVYIHVCQQNKSALLSSCRIFLLFFFVNLCPLWYIIQSEEYIDSLVIDNFLSLLRYIHYPGSMRSRSFKRMETLEHTTSIITLSFVFKFKSIFKLQILDLKHANMPLRMSISLKIVRYVLYMYCTIF